MTILKVIYWLGLASCGIQGYQKACKNHHNSIKRMLSAFLCAFGGGLTRDIAILHTHPSVLSISCLPEVIIAVGSALLYSCFSYVNRFSKLFIVITDSMGLAQFITIGVDRALCFKENQYALAIVSGVITSLAGGIISSIFSGESIKKTLCTDPLYRITDLVGAIIYVFLLKNNVDKIYAQSTIVLCTLICTTICNHMVLKWMEKFVTKALRVITPHYINWLYWQIIINLSILAEHLCGKTAQLMVLPTRQPILNRQRTFLYHRLRQM